MTKEQAIREVLEGASILFTRRDVVKLIESIGPEETDNKKLSAYGTEEKPDLPVRHEV